MASQQIRPKIELRYSRINQPVRVPTYDLLVDAYATVLTTDTVSGVSVFTVRTITNFAKNQILLTGEVGNLGTEVIKTSGTTAPSGSTITLNSTTAQPHSAGTNVRIINYDIVEFSSAATVGGAKTLLATAPITGILPWTQYDDNAGTTGFYYARFKNSITAVYSPYSDASPVGGYTELMARSVIDKALLAINDKTSDLLSDEFAFSELNNCQIEVLRELKRWSWMQSFNQIIGTAVAGGWKVALPTDCDDQNTQKSIYNFRIGRENRMTWVDREKFIELTQNVAYSTLATQIAVGAATIKLADSSDFGASGAVVIGSNNYSFTVNVPSTGALTLDAVSTTTNKAGADVFLGASSGLPLYFNVFGGYLYHWPIVAPTYDKRNYYLDYYKKITLITGDYDSLVIPDPLVAQYYLQWKFMLRKNNGIPNDAVAYHQTLYTQRKEKLKQKETEGRVFQLRPRFNDWSRQMTKPSDDERQRVGNFPNT